MIDNMIFLFSSGSMIGDVFKSWEQAGFFQYLFPLILLFALVFGILTKINLFKDNKALNGLIALVVAIISIQQSFVADFFMVLFPRLGIGLILLLSAVIILGLVLPPKWDGVFLVVAGVIIILVFVYTADAIGWSSGYWWKENWTNILGLVIIIGLVLGLIFSGSKSEGDVAGSSMLGRLLAKND